jgi:hypothetical protein
MQDKKHYPACLEAFMATVSYGRRGHLEYDPDEDRLLCHLCGGWFRSLASHARRAHSLSANDYRELAGLNRQTHLLSPGMRSRLREVTAPTITRLRAEGALRNWGEDAERRQRDKQAAISAIREGLRAEGSEHRRQSWSEERRRERAEFRRQRNLAGQDRATSEAISAGLKRYYAEHPEAIDYERLRHMAHQPQISEKTARAVVCPRCQAEFTAPSHRDKYCPACRPALAREYDREYKRWRRQEGDNGTLANGH